MNKPYLELNSDHVKGKIDEWWKSIFENRGDGADLRRCHDLNDVFFCPAYHRLYQNLRDEGSVNKEALALIAVSLAHIKDNQPNSSFATQMGEEKSDGTSQVSETRFRKLIRSETYPDLFSPVVRIIKMLNGTVNINDLIQKLYFWNEKNRQRMTFEYYEKVLTYTEKSGEKRNE